MYNQSVNFPYMNCNSQQYNNAQNFNYNNFEEIRK